MQDQKFDPLPCVFVAVSPNMASLHVLYSTGASRAKTLHKPSLHNGFCACKNTFWPISPEIRIVPLIRNMPSGITELNAVILRPRTLKKTKYARSYGQNGLHSNVALGFDHAVVVQSPILGRFGSSKACWEADMSHIKM